MLPSLLRRVGALAAGRCNHLHQLPPGAAAAPHRRWFSDTVRITVVTSHGSSDIDAPLGETLMDIALEHDLDMECACEGQLACSTCHVYVHDDYFDRLPEMTEEEEDMLDLAWGLEDNSRLGCQIKMTKELDGLVVTIPDDDL